MNNYNEFYKALKSQLNKKRNKDNLIAEFRQGSGFMAQNAIDYYQTDKGILKHSWAMGGESKKIVESVPKSIDGYERLIHIVNCKFNEKLDVRVVI